MILCPRCQKENVNGTKYCYNCGLKLPESHITDINRENLCPNCRTPNPLTARFCMHCGEELNRLREKETHKKLIDYWYCRHDRNMLVETSSTHQFPVAKSIDESLSSLVDERTLKPEEVNDVKNLAHLCFLDDPSKNFAVITRVRCPICLNTFFAPVYSQPTKEISRMGTDPPSFPSYQVVPGYSIYPQQRYSVSNTIKTTFEFILSNPIILLIPALIIIIEYFIEYFIPLYNSTSISIWLIDGYLLDQLSNKPFEFIFGLLLDFLLEISLITILLVSYNNLRNRSEGKIPVQEITTTSLRFLPKLIIAKIIVDIIISISLSLPGFFFAFIISLELSYSYLLPVIVFLLVFTSILLVSIIFIYAFFSYVNPIIVINDETVFNSIIGSLKFSKKYLFQTFSLIFIFLIGPILIPVNLDIFGINVLISRISEVFLILCLASGFDNYKHTLE